MLRWLFFDNHKFTSYFATLRFMKSFMPTAPDPAVMKFLSGRVEGAWGIVEKHLARSAAQRFQPARRRAAAGEILLSVRLCRRTDERTGRQAVIAGRTCAVHTRVMTRAASILFPASLALFAMATRADEPVIGGPCQGCEAVFVGKPATLSSVARIAPAGEQGEPMRVTGVVTAPDGVPRANVVVYAYQTNAAGIYPPPARSLGRWPDRHGKLRGWALTDGEGRYTFETIRPGSYPSQSVSQHIHMHVIEPDCATYYIDNIQFTDDPLLTENERRHQADARAGSGLATPVKDASGTWQVTRDIRLGKNIPGYTCGQK